MKLDGIHHVTAITGDAPRNLDFYARVLGLRLVKKTVNQDDPTVYHLFYADEKGSPGADLTFFEYPGAAPGRAGAGMVHLISWRVASEEALDFWARAAGRRGRERRARRGNAAVLRPRGAAARAGGVERRRRAPDRRPPRGARRGGVAGVRRRAGVCGGARRTAAACWRRRWASRPAATAGRHAGSVAGAPMPTTAPPAEPGRPGGGTVHHVAWASEMDDHVEWRERAIEGGARPTEVIDRFWFKSIYFREPSGVLFEIATLGPGFTTDEDEHTLARSWCCRRGSSRCERRSRPR